MQSSSIINHTKRRKPHENALQYDANAACCGVLLGCLLALGMFFFLSGSPYLSEELKSTELIKMQCRNHQYTQRVIKERLYYDDNFPTIVNKSVPVVRYKEKLEYRLNLSPLLFDLASLVENESPKELMTYGKEALKSVDLYPSDSWYSRWKSHTIKAIQSNPMLDSCCCNINAFALQLSVSYGLQLYHKVGAVSLNDIHAHINDIHGHIIVATIEEPPALNCSDLFVIPPYVEPVRLPDFSLNKPRIRAVDNASK